MRIVAVLNIIIAINVVAWANVGCSSPQGIAMSSGALPETAARSAPWKVRNVTFVGPYWTAQNRAAALRGINASEGAHRYRVLAVEVSNGGLPVRFVDHRNLLGSAVSSGAIRQASRSGCTVHGSFHPADGISINAVYRNDLRSIANIAEHEADHWSGRRHISSRDRKSLERISGGLIPESMTWAPWPDSGS